MPVNQLVLLPGLDGTGELFKPFIEALRKDFDLKVISYPKDQKLDYPVLVELVESQLDPNQPIHILAESFSGVIALKLLERNNLKIEKLILVASFISTPKKPLLSLIARLPIEKILPYKIPDFILKLFCLGIEASPEMINSFNQALRSVSPQVIACRLKELMKLGNMEFNYQNCNNIFYIQAENDRLVSARHLKQIAKTCSLQSLSIKGPHFVLQAKPKECAAAVMTFLLESNY